MSNSDYLQMTRVWRRRNNWRNASHYYTWTAFSNMWESESESVRNNQTRNYDIFLRYKNRDNSRTKLWCAPTHPRRQFVGWAIIIDSRSITQVNGYLSLIVCWILLFFFVSVRAIERFVVNFLLLSFTVKRTKKKVRSTNELNYNVWYGLSN